MSNTHGGAGRGQGRKSTGDKTFISGFLVSKERGAKLKKIVKEKKITRTEFFGKAIDKG